MFKDFIFLDLCHIILANKKIPVFRVTRPHLNLLVKPSIFFRFSGKSIILCILKSILPFKRHEIIYFSIKKINKKPVCLPTKNFQTCYPKHAYFLFGLSLSYISYLQEWIQENDVLSIVLKDNLHQPQYVEKLEKILRFMIKEKALSLQNLDKLWEAQVHIDVRAYCTVQICLLGECVIFNSFLTCGDFSSADNLCKQFGPRSGPTFCRS